MLPGVHCAVAGRLRTAYIGRNRCIANLSQDQTNINSKPRGFTSSGAWMARLIASCSRRLTRQQMRLVLPAGPLRCEALAAVDRLVAAGLEGNVCRLSTRRANCFVHLAVARVVHALARPTAVRAPRRLVLEPTLHVKLLLTGGKYEVPATVAAIQGLVLVCQLDHASLGLDSLLIKSACLKVRALEQQPCI